MVDLPSLQADVDYWSSQLGSATSLLDSINAETPDRTDAGVLRDFDNRRAAACGRRLVASIRLASATNHLAEGTTLVANGG